MPSALLLYNNTNPFSPKSKVTEKEEKMKKGEKSSKGNGKSEVRKDRRSNTGMSGSPKKGGHGGKFTWAGDGYYRAELGFEKEVMDVKDPNFEDPEEIVSAV